MLVTFAAGVDIAASLEVFRRSGDDLIDRWDGARLVRCLRVGTVTVPFRADLRAPDAFHVSCEDAYVEPVQACVASSFVAAPASYAALLASDPVLARLDAALPGIRQVRQLDLFTALVRCISAQQVNLRWAATTRRRLAEAFGERHTIAGETVYWLDPARIASLSPSEIRALQFTTSKAVSLIAVARAVVDGHARLEDLHTMHDEEVVRCLTHIRGIGRWSAEWVLARTLGRPTVVAGDLGVRKAVGLAYLDNPIPTEAEVRAATAHWGEAAGSAQALVLHALGEGLLSPARPVRRPVKSPLASRA
jgi:DNA-3-methyladenine glycosylase II